MTRPLAVLALCALTSCTAARKMSTRDAPPNPGCCGKHLWAGDRLLVTYSGGGLKSYDPVANSWRNEAPLPKGLGNIYAAGGHAVAIKAGLAAVYDLQAQQWRLFPGPAVEGHSAVVALESHLLVLPLLQGQRHPAGGAVFDPRSQTWTAIPGSRQAPPHRYAVLRFVNDSLVWLPGQDTASDTSVPGAMWRIGDPGWTEMSPGPQLFDEREASAVIGSVLIVNAGRSSQWWRFDVDKNQWSKVSAKGALPRARRTFVSGRRMLVPGSGAAVYDLETDSWSPSAIKSKSPDYMLAADDGRVVLLDGSRRPESVYDISSNSLSALDASGLPDTRVVLDVVPRRSFRLRAWTGRCLVHWGEDLAFGPSGAKQCENAPPDMGCDPVSTPVEHRVDGYLWCLPMLAPSDI